MNICSVRYSQMLEVQRPITQTKARRESLSLNTTLAERGLGAASNETVWKKLTTTGNAGADVSKSSWSWLKTRAITPRRP